MIAGPITLNPDLQYEGTAPSTTQIYISPPEKYIILRFDYLNDIDFILKRIAGSESYQTMLLSEDILRKDWDTPEEDEAWANL